MNFAAFERAQVAGFAYQQASYTGSLDCVRAVCFVLRNRKMAHWGDGTWLSLLVTHPMVSATFESFTLGNVASAGEGFKGDDRLLQMIVRDIDDIYLGQEPFEDRVRQVVSGDRGEIGKKKNPGALYYAFVDREPRPWFKENIIKNPSEHAPMGNVGKLLLYG